MSGWVHTCSSASKSTSTLARNLWQCHRRWQKKKIQLHPLIVTIGKCDAAPQKALQYEIHGLVCVGSPVYKNSTKHRMPKKRTFLGACFFNFSSKVQDTLQTHSRIFLLSARKYCSRTYTFSQHERHDYFHPIYP